MKLTYKHTQYTCYLAYITGALVNNFAPLLFLTFQKTFGVSLTQLALLITANFITQMIVDFVGANIVDKIGYRISVVSGNVFAALGLLLMAFLPGFMENKLPALLIATVTYAVGSGINEVLISPILEALPIKEKSSAMSMLHSFYCWGCVIVISLSTLFFHFFSTEKWQLLTCIWTIVPVLTVIMFLIVPIYSLEKEGEKSNVKTVFSMKYFWLFMLLMTCSGAAELSIAQWASLFAEEGLGVSKTVGDLLGPCLFAVLMGIGRVAYALFSKKWNLMKFMIFCSVGCILSYLVTTLPSNPFVSLIGCAMCGFFVAISWPGMLSLAASHYKAGGTAMFGILALSGDIGCFLGPEVVALCSKLDFLNSPIKSGILCSAIFPVIMLVSIIILNKKIGRCKKSPERKKENKYNF